MRRIRLHPETIQYQGIAPDPANPNMLKGDPLAFGTVWDHEILARIPAADSQQIHAPFRCSRDCGGTSWPWRPA